MATPTGVRILAFLQMLLGGLLLIASLIIAALAVNFFAISLLLPFLPANIVLGMLGLIFMAVGAGLWSLRSWAWYVNIFWYGLLLALALWSLASNAAGGTIEVIFYGLICVYLVTVKDAFK